MLLINASTFPKINLSILTNKSSADQQIEIKILWQVKLVLADFSNLVKFTCEVAVEEIEKGWFVSWPLGGATVLGGVKSGETPLDLFRIWVRFSLAWSFQEEACIKVNLLNTPKIT